MKKVVLVLFGAMDLHLKNTAREKINTEKTDIILGGQHVAFGMPLQIFVDQNLVITYIDSYKKFSSGLKLALGFLNFL